MPGSNAHSSATPVHHTNTHISPMEGLSSVTAITAAPKATASTSGYYGLFLPPGLGASDDQYGASVVNVCGNLGTYAVRCLAGNDPTGGIERCGPGAPVMTVTEGTKEFNFATTSMSGGTTTVIQQSCHITAGTAAECTAKTEWSGNTKSSTASVAKFTDATEFRQQVFPVSFTAGLPKLKFSVNSVCKSSAQSSKPISVKLVGVATMLGVWAVLAL